MRRKAACLRGPRGADGGDAGGHGGGGGVREGRRGRDGSLTPAARVERSYASSRPAAAATGNSCVGLGGGRGMTGTEMISGEGQGGAMGDRNQADEGENREGRD